MRLTVKLFVLWLVAAAVLLNGCCCLGKNKLSAVQGSRIGTGR